MIELELICNKNDIFTKFISIFIFFSSLFSFQISKWLVRATSHLSSRYISYVGILFHSSHSKPLLRVGTKRILGEYNQRSTNFRMEKATKNQHKERKAITKCPKQIYPTKGPLYPIDQFVINERNRIILDTSLVHHLQQYRNTRIRSIMHLLTVSFIHWCHK